MEFGFCLLIFRENVLKWTKKQSKYSSSTRLKPRCPSRPTSSQKRLERRQVTSAVSVVLLFILLLYSRSIYQYVRSTINVPEQINKISPIDPLFQTHFTIFLCLWYTIVMPGFHSMYNEKSCVTFQ